GLSKNNESDGVRKAFGSSMTDAISCIPKCTVISSLVASFQLGSDGDFRFAEFTGSSRVSSVTGTFKPGTVKEFPFTFISLEGIDDLITSVTEVTLNHLF